MLSFLLHIWQLPQHLAGFVLSHTGENVRTEDLGEGIRLYIKKSFLGCGVSLGNYIILQTTHDHASVINHERGHSKQSQYLGFLYLIIIGIPSATGNVIDRIFHKDWQYRDIEKWYYSLPWEAWADRLGGVKRWWH